jgi:mannose-6-phosphate isomerase-like protein (cupin superfamily)
MDLEKDKDTLRTKVLKREHDYLAPDGSEIRLLADLEAGGLAHCTLPPGRVSLAQRHKTVGEIWYFVHGKGEVWRKKGEAEQVDEVGPGHSLSIEAGTHFQFRNTGREPLELITATIPAWPGPQEAVEVRGVWQPDG